jgi:adenylate cyclase, class 2
MSYEVEQKFRVPDLLAIEARLTAMGVEIAPPHEEADLYFAHPARDFAKTDEALRLRRKGDHYRITYKGPKIDATTKTRREIELPLPPGQRAFADWTELLEALGFRGVAEVRKSRRKAIVPWQGREIEASLDQVERVGTFVELEQVADVDDMEAAKTAIASLARELGLSGSERTSYLEMLLKNIGSQVA